MGKCAICEEETRSAPDGEDYVCKRCDRKAVNKDGETPWTGFKPGNRPETEDGVIRLSPDQGENPVFIDGHKCKRRYRFGGHVTWVVERNSDEAPDIDWEERDELF